jgi:hypothetical protein
MKKSILIITCACLALQSMAQRHINKSEISIIAKNLKSDPLLVDDNDFNVSASTKWTNEGAVILSQKTSFSFDKKGLSAGTIIGRNLMGLLFALPTMGWSIYGANANNGNTKMIVEETERRKLLLNDKYSLEQYSVLYFRLYAEKDAFAARVIKKDGSTKNVDIEDAIAVDNLSSVPDIFKSYTDRRFTSAYRPNYYKIAVPDLEEGDVIEYEFRNINSKQFANNPSYKEFYPVYYVCNRSMPVVKQIIEVNVEDDKYHLAYKNLKNTPSFSEVTDKHGNKVYRWEDDNRDKYGNAKFVNKFTEMPVMKFQVKYAKNNSQGLIWFKSDDDIKKDMQPEEFVQKTKIIWFEPNKMQGAAFGEDGKASINAIENAIYKELKKHGINSASDDEYVRKAYYSIRSKTVYNNWDDYNFAKVFSALLNERKIPHEVIVTTNNQLTDLSKVAFTSELGWLIKYNKKYYCNPDEHLNPEEMPSIYNGNLSVRFNPGNTKEKETVEPLPVSDTLSNTITVQVMSSMPDVNQSILNIEKTTEAKGLVKSAYIDDALALTPFIENDYRNYDGTGMWEGLSSVEEEKATTEFNHQKKEWKEDKPLMMEESANGLYNDQVEKYNSFRVVEDGRSYKKNQLKYVENFSLNEMTSRVGEDIIIKIPFLMGEQTKIKKEDRTRTLPINIRYEGNFTYNIAFDIPVGYTIKGWEALNQRTDNEFASFTGKAKIVNNQLLIQAKQVFKNVNVKAENWPAVVQVLDATYKFSQRKLLLKKI